MDQQKPPLISIITVVRNGEKTLERTIRSVTQQTFKNFEYIIIDGDSSDGTLDIIELYGNDISFWVTEPDSGIYNAMNKGISLSSGNYLWFINSGDELYSEDTIEKIVPAILEDPDIIYGDVVLFSEETNTGRKLKAKVLSRENLSNGMIVCHQSVLCSRKIIVKYNENYDIVADHDWLIHIASKARRVFYQPFPLSIYLAGGVSDKRFFRAWRQRFSIINHHYSKFHMVKNIIHFGAAVAKRVVRSILRGTPLLPEVTVTLINVSRLTQSRLKR